MGRWIKTTRNCMLFSLFHFSQTRNPESPWKRFKSES